MEPDFDSAESHLPPEEPITRAEEQRGASEQLEGEEPDTSEAATSMAHDEPLAELAERASRGRLPSAEEDRATQLLREALGGGREGVARAVEHLPQLPWIIGVNSVTSAWPEMKPTMRNRLLAGLARLDTDAARRVRLSLARGLFKLDLPVATKLAVAVAKEMRDKETGALAPRDAQVFANVLIGRARPWIAQLPLAGLKPAEAEALAHGALFAVFLVPHAPATQLGVLKWAAEAGKLAKLPALATETIIKALARWNGKWQSTLRREIAELPEEIASTLRPEAPAPAEPDHGRARRGDAAELADNEKEERECEGERPVAADTGRDGEEDERADEDELDREERAAASVRPRPIYESKTVPARDRDRERLPERRSGPTGNFQLSEALRAIEAHVASLRSELSLAQSKLRQREDQGRRGIKPERATAPIIVGAPTADELARLNVQLEARNAELQQRIEELTVDSEERAASMGILGGEPVTDDDLRLRKLLALKLQDDHEDFLALESESPDMVAPKHYRTVLLHVVEVLTAEGILSRAPAPPA